MQSVIYAAAVLIVVFQLFFFVKTLRTIYAYSRFFPDISADVFKLDTSVSKNDLENEEALKQFSANPQYRALSMGQPVSLVGYHENAELSADFKAVLTQTNMYLCKNTGTSADLAVLQDICERKLDTIDDRIQSELNIPLYLGLGGTFIGIICGLLSLDLDSILNIGGHVSDLKDLLMGVGIAMIASFCGLSLMLINTYGIYSRKFAEVDSRKNDYFSFLRRELMPTLSNSMASSLNSLKGVLGNFVDEFGKSFSSNIESFHDSFELLNENIRLTNENLDKQDMVLAKIEGAALTRTAAKISETFTTLSDSADKFSVFNQYQEELNGTIRHLDETAGSIKEIVAQFTDFSSQLRQVVVNQTMNRRLQEQFQESLELHFPTSGDAQEQWRKAYDQLVEDAKATTGQLQEQLRLSSGYVGSFVEGNRQFFTSFEKIVQYFQMQMGNDKALKALKEEIAGLRKDLRVSRGLGTGVSRLGSVSSASQTDIRKEELAKSAKDLQTVKSPVAEAATGKQTEFADTVKEQSQTLPVSEAARKKNERQQV